MKIKLNNRINNLINKYKFYFLTGTMIGIISSFSLTKLEEHTMNQVTDITIEDVKDRIYTSNRLTLEEKKYLFNSDFFHDYLKTINESPKSKEALKKKLQNIDIVSYEKNDKNEGYYIPSHPNILFVSEYEGINSIKKDTIAHEFIHLCQNDFEYRMITEATAELISNEYYDLTIINSYINEVTTLKVLMEIIGTEPIWDYVFNNDFNQIKRAITPYLSKGEYIDFIKCLKIVQEDEEDRRIKNKRLNELIDIIYKNKYQKDISEDLIISLIRKHDLSLRRYYFNPRFINQENSYYRYGDDYIEEYLTLEEADKEGLILFLDDKDQISYNDYLQNKDKSNVYYVNVDGEIINDTLHIFLAPKIYLPTIYERNEINKVKQKEFSN